MSGHRQMVDRVDRAIGEPRQRADRLPVRFAPPTHAHLALAILRRQRQLTLRQHPLRASLAPRLGNLIALSWYEDGRPRSVDGT